MLPANIETRAYRGEDVEVIVSDWIRDQEVAAIAARYGISQNDEGYVLMMPVDSYEAMAAELWPLSVEGIERLS